MASSSEKGASEKHESKETSQDSAASEIVIRQQDIQNQSNANSPPNPDIENQVAKAEELHWKAYAEFGVPLCQAAQKRDTYKIFRIPLWQSAQKRRWIEAKRIIEAARGAGVNNILRASITHMMETVLHVAVASQNKYFVEKLVEVMSPDDLRIRNCNGNTAFFYAAMTDNVGIAKILVERDPGLAKIRGANDLTPLDAATISGYHPMAKFLLEKTLLVLELERIERINLLMTFIDNDMYDLAWEIVQSMPPVDSPRPSGDSSQPPQPSSGPSMQPQEPWQYDALKCLAQKPFSLIPRTNILQRWRRRIFSKGSGADNSQHSYAISLLKCLWEDIVKTDLRATASNVPSEFMKHSPEIIHEAAKMGNVEFLVELIRIYPDILIFTDSELRTLFHVAVMHRQRHIFNLIYNIGPYRNHLTTATDIYGNNMLHLAGYAAPPQQLSKISGEALQMQRELLWFEVVEEVIHPLERKTKNGNGKTTQQEKGEGEAPHQGNGEGKTPQELFAENHKDLKLAAHDWLNKVSISSMFIAVIITICGFVAVPTPPGGVKTDIGVTNLMGQRWFSVLAVSHAVALLSSAASILFFWSILTSTRKTDDFMGRLPRRMAFGIFTLIISVLAVAFAYTASVFLAFLGRGKIIPWVVFGLAVFLVVVVLGYSIRVLLIQTFHSVFGSRFLFRRSKYELFGRSNYELI